MTETITNEMANPPHCDRDKLICPFARWADGEIERLRTALHAVRDYIKDCDHEPALDEIDAALRQTREQPK